MSHSRNDRRHPRVMGVRVVQGETQYIYDLDTPRNNTIRRGRDARNAQSSGLNPLAAEFVPSWMQTSTISPGASPCLNPTAQEFIPNDVSNVSDIIERYTRFVEESTELRNTAFVKQNPNDSRKYRLDRNERRRKREERRKAIEEDLEWERENKGKLEKDIEQWDIKESEKLDEGICMVKKEYSDININGKDDFVDIREDEEDGWIKISKICEEVYNSEENCQVTDKDGLGNEANKMQGKFDGDKERQSTLEQNDSENIYGRNNHVDTVCSEKGLDEDDKHESSFEIADNTLYGVRNQIESISTEKRKFEDINEMRVQKELSNGSVTTLSERKIQFNFESDINNEEYKKQDKSETCSEGKLPEEKEDSVQEANDQPNLHSDRKDIRVVEEGVIIQNTKKNDIDIIMGGNKSDKVKQAISFALIRDGDVVYDEQEKKMIDHSVKKVISKSTNNQYINKEVQTESIEDMETTSAILPKFLSTIDIGQNVDKLNDLRKAEVTKGEESHIVSKDKIHVSKGNLGTGIENDTFNKDVDEMGPPNEPINVRNKFDTKTDIEGTKTEENGKVHCNGHIGKMEIFQKGTEDSSTKMTLDNNKESDDEKYTDLNSIYNNIGNTSGKTRLDIVVKETELKMEDAKTGKTNEVAIKSPEDDDRIKTDNKNGAEMITKHNVDYVVNDHKDDVVCQIRNHAEPNVDDEDNGIDANDDFDDINPFILMMCCY